MKSTSAEQLQAHLIQLGLKKGKNLFIHSNMSALGQFSPGPPGLYEILRNLIGQDATIVAPAYRITAPPDEVFDPASSPSLGVGSFSEFLRKRPGVSRSLCPIHSHVFDGPLARGIEARGFVPSFGKGSDFDYLLGKKFYGLFLGCDFQSAGTLVFHAQAIANSIPYREWQVSRRLVRHYVGTGTVEDRAIELPYYARKTGAPREDRRPIERHLLAGGKVNKSATNYGSSLSFDYDVVQGELLELLKARPDICVPPTGPSA